MDNKLNTYHCFYRGKKVELQAATSFDAQQAGAKHFKAKKAYDVTPVLVGDAEGTPVTHDGASL